jgi:PAS domain S-box-containing protein
VKTELNTYELQEREHLFRMVFEESPDAIFIEDLAGNVLDANPAACRLHGLTRDELIGMNASALVPPDQRGSVAHAEQLVGHAVRGYSLDAAGRSIPVSIRTSKISYMGRPALLLQVRDITERLRTEEALRESESRYRLLFDSNPQPMWVYDLETRRFIAINETALRLYRYSQDEFLLMETVDSILADPDKKAPELPKLPNLVEVTTAKHRRKDGAALTVELTQHTLSLDGRLVAFVMISKIISTR